MVHYVPPFEKRPYWPNEETHHSWGLSGGAGGPEGSGLLSEKVADLLVVNLQKLSGQCELPLPG